MVFDIPIQLTMFFGMFLLIPFMLVLGFSYQHIQKTMIKSMAEALETSLILLGVGMLIGTWIASGTVPTIVFYGIEFISPRFFLVTTLIFTSVVSLSTGTSWGAIGTAGVAMMGIGGTMGIPSGITAASIISGAFFGDKMSPLSDTTNLTPLVSGAKLYDHVRQMTYSIVPSYILTTDAEYYNEEGIEHHNIIDWLLDDNG